MTDAVTELAVDDESVDGRVVYIGRYVDVNYFISRGNRENMKMSFL